MLTFALQRSFQVGGGSGGTQYTDLLPHRRVSNVHPVRTLSSPRILCVSRQFMKTSCHGARASKLKAF